MENTLYPPMTIQLDVYYYFEDDTEQVCVFDEEEMRSDFERKLEELKNKFGSSEK
jgi:hypothetical protein